MKMRCRKLGWFSFGSGHVAIHRHVTIISLALLPLVNCGCSMFIMSQGKHLEYVFTPTATRQNVQQELGAPVGLKTYDHATKLSDIPEITTVPLWYRHADLTALAGGYDDYRYKGIIYDNGADQAVGMVVGMTFGLGELWAFPESLRYTAAEKKKEHFFRVWYSPAGYCVAYLWRPVEGQDMVFRP